MSPFSAGSALELSQRRPNRRRRRRPAGSLLVLLGLALIRASAVSARPSGSQHDEAIASQQQAPDQMSKPQTSSTEKTFFSYDNANLMQNQGQQQTFRGQQGAREFGSEKRERENNSREAFQNRNQHQLQFHQNQYVKEREFGLLGSIQQRGKRQVSGGEDTLLAEQLEQASPAPESELQKERQSDFSERWIQFWSRKPFPSDYTQSSIILLACFIGIIILLIVVGNLLVCIAIFTEKSLKATQNWFIASLAVSDMLLGLTVMPFSLARELMGFWMFGPLWCDIHEAMDVLLTTASINTLCLISLDRYWSITQAVNYLKKRTPRRGALMIAFVWVFSAAVSLPPLFGWRKQAPALTITTSNSTSGDPSAPERQTRSALPSGSAHLASRDQLPIPHIRALRLQADFLQQPTDDRHQASANYNSFQEPPTTTQIPALPTGIATDLHQQQSHMGVTEYPTCQLSDDVGYVVYSALGSFYLPCAVMVFTYIKIFLAARSRARRTIVAKPSRNKANQQQQDRRHQAGAINPTSSLRNKLASSMGSPTPTQTPNETCQPPMRGKIVIVERKKSLAASSLAQLSSDPSENQKLLKLKSGGLSEDATSQPVSLTTSHAQQASAKSAFESTQTNLDNLKQGDDADGGHSESASSIVTVMKPSMGELPAMRFNFQTNDVELLATRERAEEEKRQASALLEAITSIAISEPPAEGVANQQSEEGESGDDKSNKQQSLQGPSTKETCFMTMDEDSEMLDLQQAGRTVCMVAGRHDQGVDSKASELDERQTISMKPASSRYVAGSAQSCTNLACRRRQRRQLRLQQQQQQQPATVASVATPASGNRSGSSYCGSDASMLDGDDDAKRRCYEADDDDDVDADDSEGLISEDACNGFSLSCDDVDSRCSQCHECDGDEISTQSYLIKHHQQHHSSSISAADSPCSRKARYQHGQRDARLRNENQSDVDLEASRCHVQGKHRHTRAHKKSSIAINSDEDCCHHHMHGDDLDGDGDDDDLRCDDYEDEQDDEIDDDDIDLDEETSSVMGRGILDATAKRKKSHTDKETSRRKSISAESTIKNNNNSSQYGRKRSIIGIRLPSLGGGSRPSSAQAVEHQDSAAAKNRRESIKQQASSINNIDSAISSMAPITAVPATSTIATHTTTTSSITAITAAVAQSAIGIPASLPGATTTSSGCGTRNLKALRQNFFLKLNQLTAKSSSAKDQQKTQKLLSASSSDKPSLSYEPSTSCANDYPMETTLADDYEPQTSGDHQMDSGSNQPANSSDQDEETKARKHLANNTDKSQQQQHQRPNSAQQLNRRGQFGNSKSMIVSSSSAERSGFTTFDDHSGNSFNRQQQHLRDQQLNLQQQQSQSTQQKNRLVQIEPTSRMSMGGIGGGGQGRSLGAMCANASLPGTKRAHLPSDTERHKRKLAKARERRATRILGLIMAAFITSWMPFFTYYIVRALCSACRGYISPRIEAFIFWMGYCNSAINPIIYTIFNRDFRKAFRKILFRCL